jgi:hypothetical protein
MSSVITIALILYLFLFGSFLLVIVSRRRVTESQSELMPVSEETQKSYTEGRVPICQLKYFIYTLMKIEYFML